MLSYRGKKMEADEVNEAFYDFIYKLICGEDSECVSRRLQEWGWGERESQVSF